MIRSLFLCLLSFVSLMMCGQTILVYSNADDGFLNVRQQPNANSDIIAVLYNGKSGAVLVDKDANKYWYKVSVNGNVGFVNKRYALLSEESCGSDSDNTFRDKDTKLRIGLSTDECRRICGEPDEINRQVYPNRIVEFWFYKNPKRTLHFRNGYLNNFSYRAK